MHDCLISFGSNLGDGFELLERSVEHLSASEVVGELRVSPAIRTQPVGGPQGQSAYLNAVIRCTSSLSAVALHQRMLEIESDLGRVRKGRWGSRTVDLDLLLYDEIQIESDTLTVPHPRMAYRRFVLEPAVCVAAEMNHPVCGCELGQLLARLEERPSRILLVDDTYQPGSGWSQQFGSPGDGLSSRVVCGDLLRPGEPGPGQWHILRLNSVHARDWLASSKLLVQRRQEVAAIPLVEYQGPRLLLEELDDEVVRVELVAAMQAMSSI